VTAFYLVDNLVGNIIEDDYLAGVVGRDHLKQFIIGVPLDAPHWGRVLVGVGFLEGLGSVDLDGLV
jgi:hypothetical protein